MDGTLAALFFILGLGDMALNDCPTGCLAIGDAPARLTAQVSGVEFDEDWIGTEIGFGLDAPRRYGPFQPFASVSLSNDRDLWIGAGAKWTSEGVLAGPLFVEATFQPGLHFATDGPDLGGALHFRAGLGVGYAFDNGGRVTVSYDHRSNGDRLDLNPGLETLTVRYGWEWN